MDKVESCSFLSLFSFCCSSSSSFRFRSSVPSVAEVNKLLRPSDIAGVVPAVAGEDFVGEVAGVDTEAVDEGGTVAALENNTVTMFMCQVLDMISHSFG